MISRIDCAACVQDGIFHRGAILQVSLVNQPSSYLPATRLPAFLHVLRGFIFFRCLVFFLANRNVAAHHASSREAPVVQILSCSIESQLTANFISAPPQSIPRQILLLLRFTHRYHQDNFRFAPFVPVRSDMSDQVQLAARSGHVINSRRRILGDWMANTTWTRPLEPCTACAVKGKFQIRRAPIAGFRSLF